MAHHSDILGKNEINIIIMLKSQPDNIQSLFFSFTMVQNIRIMFLNVIIVCPQRLQFWYQTFGQLLDKVKKNLNVLSASDDF